MIDKQKFNQALISWYDQSKRILPWRDNPNPYHVWVSEIMLQQTRVEAVIPFFNRFIKEVPKVEELAKIDDDRLNKLWEGLGYYSRARNLKKAALIIVNEFDGLIPSNQEALESLPGIGSYTSGAILSIAYNKAYTAVDGNVLRVFARILANKGNIKDPSVKKEIRFVVSSILPKSRIGDYNQALMEIGATVCKPNGNPDCLNCPLISFCEANKNDLLAVIPLKQVKKKRRKEEKTVFVLNYNNKFAIERRPNNGLLAGLYQFPNVDGHMTAAEVRTQFPHHKSIKIISSSKHIFSHIEWYMNGYYIELLEPLDSYIFINKEDIELTYSIPTAFKTYKQFIKEDYYEL